MINLIAKLNPAIEPIIWRDGILEILDQRELPNREKWIKIDNLEKLIQVIKCLAIRGAPLLGIAAGYGVIIGLSESKTENFTRLSQEFEKVKNRIASSRPTARNLFDTLEKMCTLLENHTSDNPVKIISNMEKLAISIHQKERENCKAIAEHGIELFRNCKSVLTHCNTGVLATGGIGTAMGVIQAAHSMGYLENVYVDETRPLLQGARLTAWELEKLKIDYSLICDNMAASIIFRGKVDAIITGADRIALNGDSANKIGTMGLAVLAEKFNIPFYIAAPSSTIDFSLNSGNQITIEQREAEEVRGWRNITWAPAGCQVLNPAFDITPGELISGIITEKGVVSPPYSGKIEKLNHQ